MQDQIITETSILSEEFEITIPEAIRQRHNWKVGQKFKLESNGPAVLIVPILTIDDIFGIAKNADPEGYRDRDDRY